MKKWKPIVRGAKVWFQDGSVIRDGKVSKAISVDQGIVFRVRYKVGPEARVCDIDVSNLSRSFEDASRKLVLRSSREIERLCHLIQRYGNI